jgi:methionyl-tRNA synthetase
VKEEAFVPDNEAELAGYKDLAGNPLQKMKEESYFFKMSKYQEKLLAHYAANPEFLQPEGRKKEILSRLKEPLRDLCVSRTTFEWGVPIPATKETSKNHVMYVWFDALSNYLSGINYHKDIMAGKPSKYWNATNGQAPVHIIGKDITWFHCVIWPCMLMSVDIPLFDRVYAHGFVQDKEGQKMSKSIGNVVDPNDQLDKFPMDTFRYYTVSQTPYGGDLPFSEDSLRLLHNSGKFSFFSSSSSFFPVFCFLCPFPSSLTTLLVSTGWLSFLVPLPLRTRGYSRQPRTPRRKYLPEILRRQGPHRTS